MNTIVLGQAPSGMNVFSDFAEAFYSYLMREQLLDYLPNIVLAMILGAFLGWERRQRHKTAGVRTHMVVAASAALITLCGVVITTRAGIGDPTRLAAQILAGIGFIGAGVILKKGIATSGVTTAGTIFFSVAVGIACGFNLFPLAVITTLLMVFGLTLARKFVQPNDFCHPITIRCKQDQFIQVRELFGEGAVLDGFTRFDTSQIEFIIEPKLTPAAYQALLEKLIENQNVTKVTIAEVEE
jgi:uncharacterized membrane protein YhiD involved in acid resistance